MLKVGKGAETLFTRSPLNLENDCHMASKNSAPLYTPLKNV